MKAVTNSNFLQTNEYKVKQNWQVILLLKEQVWSRYDPSAYQESKLTPNPYNFCRKEGHALTKCIFMEKDVYDATINQFQTRL
jgi:hypothetical protein